MDDNNFADNINQAEPKQTLKREEQFVMRETVSKSIKKYDVKCQQCGEKRRILWQPGMKCPVCNSSQFQPIIKVNLIEEKKVLKESNIKFSTKKLNLNLKKINYKKYLGILLSIFLLGVWIKIGYIMLKDNFKKNISVNQTLKWEYVCSHCGHKFTDIPKIPPIKCPLCGNKTAYITFECLDCKKKFTLKEKSRNPVCPYCSSSRIKTYYPFKKEVKK